MNKPALTLALTLATGGLALIASPVASLAQAADTIVTREYYPQPSYLQPAPVTLCDQFGRCWRERTTRVIEQDAYDYAPRPPAVIEQRVYQRPAYVYERPAPVYREAPAYYDAPSAGIGVTVRGASVGVGLNTW